MTAPQWILHGPGKHDRAVCDTAETWAKIFMLMYATMIEKGAYGDASLFAARHAKTIVAASNALDAAFAGGELANLAAIIKKPEHA